MTRLSILVGTRKGLFILGADRKRRAWSIDGPAFPRPGRQSRGDRSARRPHAARRRDAPGTSGHTVYRSDDSGPRWERVADAARVFQGALGRRRSVAHVFWLTPGAAKEPGPLVRGHVARRDCSSPMTAGATGRASTDSTRHPDRRKWIGAAERRAARRRHAALDQRRSVRRAPPLHRAFGRRRLRVARPRRDVDAAQRRMRGRLPSRPRTRRTGTIPIACACIPRSATWSTSRTTAASTARSRAPTAGSASATDDAQGQSATSAFRWCCTRAIRRRRGYSRWTAAPCGRACRSAASPRSTCTRDAGQVVEAPRRGAARRRRPGSR